MKIRVEAPAEVRNFINQNELFSRSGDPLLKQKTNI